VSPQAVLIVATRDDAWGLHRYLAEAVHELGHPLADRLEVVVDHKLELSFRARLPGLGAVVLLVQDPLGPLYPDVYRYALELARLCDDAGVPLVNRPDAVSRTCKTVQLLLLRRAGLDAPRAVRLAHWRDALDGDVVPFPLLLRYDCGHASEDMGFAGPFSSPEELLRARLPEHDAWPTRRNLAGLAAVEFFDTRCDDGLYRTLRGWVIGDRVIRTRLTIARFWHGHRPSVEDQALFRDEIMAFLHAEPDDEERALLLAAARATGLELVAIDHGLTRDGRHVVYDVNPYPGMLPWWSADAVFRRRVVDAFAALVESSAAA
jgi:hypothetical protein